MPPKKKKRKKAVRKKTARRKSTGPKRRGRRKKFKLKLPKLKKNQIRNIVPTLKLLLVFVLGYIVYSIGTTQIPENRTPKSPTQKVASSTPKVTRVKKPPVVTPRKVIKKSVAKPKPTPKVQAPTPVKKVIKATPKPKAQPKARIWSNQPKLIFVIDDIGHKLENEKLFRDLGTNVTYAILPLLSYSKHFSQLSVITGAETILHLPFETQDGTVPGPGLITDRMSPGYVLDRLGKNLSSVPHHVGANNHMGSLGTSDPILVEIVLKEFKRRGLFFLDSYTSPNSVIVPIANRIGLPVLKRDVFLDNVDEQPAIRTQLAELEKAARRQGYGIAIGHDRHNTLTVIKEALPRLKREGFEIISLGELIEYKKQKNR